MKMYKCSFLLGLESALEYRFDFFLSLISTIFPIIIQTYLWNAIYSSSTVNNGYTYNQIILYTLIAGMVSKLVLTGFEYEINDDIRTGGLNKFIVRPIGYLQYRFCTFIGSKIPSITILMIIMTIMLICTSFILNISFSLIRILLFIISLIGAIILNFIIYFCISMLGFWFTEISKLFGTVNILLVIISGGVFPLDIFGDVITIITNILPFKYTTQFTVDIINGKLLSNEIAIGLIFQLSWILIFFGLSILMWKKGLKKYVAVGG